MPQFLLPEGGRAGDRFRLAGAEARHAAGSMRLRAGDSIDFFDGRGGRYKGLVESVGADGSLTGSLTRLEPLASPSSARVILAQSLLKPRGWDALLEKATELGVSEFLPILCERAVVKMEPGGGPSWPSKSERFGRVILSAAKQCGRPDLPALRRPQPFKEALKEAAGSGLCLLAWEGLSRGEFGENLGSAIQGARLRIAEGAPVWLFIGPEGGFTEEEKTLAASLGARLFGLGPNILRSETAALAALALIRYELGSQSPLGKKQ